MSEENLRAQQPVMPDDIPQSVSRDDFMSIQNQALELMQQLEIKDAVILKEKQRADEMSNLADRFKADFENYKKRTAETNKNQREDGLVGVIEKLLPLMDAMKQGIMMITDEKVCEGMKMIYKQLVDMLSSFGITEIPALGEQFDPKLHNAVMQVKVKDAENVNVIVEVFNKGYRLGERIIRHSVVKVGC